MRKLISLIILLDLVSKLSGHLPKVDDFIDSYVRTHNFNGTIIILSNTGTTSLDDFAAEIARQIIN